MKTMRIAAYLVIGLVVMSGRPVMADTTMTFEEFLGYDTAPIATFYSGLTFQAASSGQDWVASDVTTGNYNASSWPGGQQWGTGEYWMYDDVAAWTGVAGDNGRVSFNSSDATFVELGYGANSSLYLEAYDSAGTLIDSDTGPANLRYTNNNPNGPGTLRVDAPSGQYIAYVLIHDTGNFWEVDNIRTDASGIVTPSTPAPGAILLAGLGTSMVGWLRRRRALT
jgi:hypothetical protein